MILGDDDSTSQSPLLTVQQTQPQDSQFFCFLVKLLILSLWLRKTLGKTQQQLAIFYENM